MVAVNWVLANWTQIVAAIAALLMFLRAVAVLLPAKYSHVKENIDSFSDFVQKFIGRR